MVTGTPHLNSTEWLQRWYKTQCDGEWKHQYGVSGETVDNPGWRVKTDLARPPFQHLVFDDINSGVINHVGIEGQQILDIFMNRVESKQN